MKKQFIENGTIYTMESEGSKVENIYIEDGVIKSINLSEEEKETLKETLSQEEWIDLKSKCLMPGFHDSHLHLLFYAMTQEESVDLSGAKSIGEVQKLLKDHILQTNKKPGDWVIGTGWNHEHFLENRMPTREDLDFVSKEHFILIKRVCIHIAVANSNLVDFCSLNDAKYKTDVNVGKDEQGVTNGLVYEDGISDYVLINKPSYTKEEIEELIYKTLVAFQKQGLTSIQTDDMKTFSDMESKKNILWAYDHLRNTQRLPIRVVEQLQVSSCEELEELLKYKNELKQDKWFSIDTVKIILDGTLGGRTAALIHPYKDKQDTKGMLNYTDEELEKIMDLGYQNNLQIACHGIGDAAIEQMIVGIEKMVQKYQKDLRPRLVHCQLPSLEQIKKLKELGILVDIQPSFVSSDYEVVEQRIESKYLEQAYAWKTLLKEGISIAGSSDCPVESYRPLVGIRAAVTRQNKEGLPVGGYKPSEKLSLYEALRLYTVGSAYACKREDCLGKIKPGYLADFVILEKDPYTVSEAELDDIEVFS